MKLKSHVFDNEEPKQISSGSDISLFYRNQLPNFGPEEEKVIKKQRKKSVKRVPRFEREFQCSTNDRKIKYWDAVDERNFRKSKTLSDQRLMSKSLQRKKDRKKLIATLERDDLKLNSSRFTKIITLDADDPKFKSFSDETILALNSFKTKPKLTKTKLRMIENLCKGFLIFLLILLVLVFSVCIVIGLVFVSTVSILI